MTDPENRRAPKKWVWIIALGLVVASIVGGLAIVPVDHSFAGTFTLSRLHLGGYTLHAPPGAVVTGTWNATGGGTVDFDVVDGSDYPIYETNGTSGSFSFPSSSPPYTFEGLTIANVTDTVSVSGSYSSPVL
jgi:hypothetical protein